MRTIVCYGDSNTWGCRPRFDLRVPPQRFGPDERWPDVLAADLGVEYAVIAEGLNSRTTSFDDPLEGDDRNGRRYVVAAIESHHPVDLVIVMLGVNDLKVRFNADPITIATGAAGVAATIRASRLGPEAGPPEVLLVVPPPTRVGSDPVYLGHFAGADERAAGFPSAFQVLGDLVGVPTFDAGEHISCSDVDGIHFDGEAHRALGRVLAQQVRAWNWPIHERGRDAAQ